MSDTTEPTAAATTSAFKVPQLGDRVKDPITGFEGIVVVIATWLHGCIRVGVQPEGMHEGKPLPEQHFDQSQVTVLERNVHAPMVVGVVTDAKPPVAETRRGPGGPVRESAGYRRS